MLFSFRPVAILASLALLSAPAVGTPALGVQHDSPAARVLEVTVGQDGEMRFAPDTVSVRAGDVIRFVAFSGVHNVHFPAEANPKVTLPPASDWLLREGDTYELKVALAPGTYHFQCDPHALMGMKGTLRVVK